MKKNIIQRLFLILFMFSIMGIGYAQDQEEPSLVQYSGVVLDGGTNQLLPVPYANIAIKNKARGTYADYTGFFSIVIERTDTLIFSTVGYKTVEVTVPDSLKDSRYSVVQLMTQDTFNLPETVVFPWPSKEHFKLEFLAMDVTEDLQTRAMKNLAEDFLVKVEKATKPDGIENANFYLREQARKNYYIGQAPPMNIFNPIAWAKFFKAWKDGKYKRKRKDD